MEIRLGRALAGAAGRCRAPTWCRRITLREKESEGSPSRRTQVNGDPSTAPPSSPSSSSKREVRESTEETAAAADLVPARSSSPCRWTRGCEAEDGGNYRPNRHRTCPPMRGETGDRTWGLWARGRAARASHGFGRFHLEPVRKRLGSQLYFRSARSGPEHPNSEDLKWRSGAVCSTILRSDKLPDPRLSKTQSGLNLQLSATAE
jgi:hypothetical protein